MGAELYTAEEIGKAVKVETATVWKWAREGIIPCITINARVKRFVLEDVIAALWKAGDAQTVADNAPSLAVAS